MSQAESIESAEIRRALGQHARHCRLFRNPRGLFWAGKVLSHIGDTVTLIHASPVKAGLVDGAGDLIGWTTIVCTPEMVGKPIAVFTAPEIKTKAGRIRTEQRTFVDAVNGAGGIAGFVRTPEEAIALVTL